MINYIIVEDNLLIYQKIKDEIDNYMMKYDYNYKVQYYKDIKDNSGHKVYYISKCDYLEIVKEIRKEDWISILFLIRPINIETNLHISDIIVYNKTTFIKSLNVSINIYNSYPKQLSFIYKNIIYKIHIKDIVYIEREYDSKHCIIYTKDSKYITTTTINEMLNKLDNNFIKTSRSTILNINYIKQYNIRENTAVLNNDIIYNSISKSKKHELISMLRNV